MANHVRQQIRERIGTVVGNLTTTGTRVYQSRVYPLQSAELPGLLIYTREEASEQVTMSAPYQCARTLRVVIEAVAKMVADLDDKLDTICKEVEIALAADQFLNGLAKHVYLSATAINLTGQGDQPMGSAVMEWTVVYYTRSNAPDVAI